MPLDGTSRTKPKAAQVRKKPSAALAARRLCDAQLGRREAEKEWDASISSAVKTGVIPDHIANPEPAGTSRVVYADDEIQISLAVVAPIVGINFAGFVASLLKAGVDAKLIARNTKRHRTETKAAHRFTCSLV